MLKTLKLDVNLIKLIKQKIPKILLLFLINKVYNLKKHFFITISYFKNFNLIFLSYISFNLKIIIEKI